MKSLGYKSSDSDADVWMKLNFNPNGDPYYKYMLLYVDELLHIGFNPKEDMDALNLIYWLKECFDLPEQYLSANVKNVQLEDGRVVWSTICVDYLKIIIENIIMNLEWIRRHPIMTGMGIGHTHTASYQN